jgi:hypothetical protein
VRHGWFVDRYRLRRNDNAYREPATLRATLDTVRGILKRQGGPYVLSRNGVNGNPRESRTLLLARLAALLPLADPEAVFRIFTKGGEGTKITIRKEKEQARPQPAVLYSYTGAVVQLDDGNPRIAEYGQWCATFSRARSAGYVYTRKVAGTNTWSQHSRFATGGNALDIAFYKNDKPRDGIDSFALGHFADELLRECKAGRFKLRRFIYQDRDYRRDHDWKPIHYGGVYHSSHVHAEAEPMQTGTPVDA